MTLWVPKLDAMLNLVECNHVQLLVLVEIQPLLVQNQLLVAAAPWWRLALAPWLRPALYLPLYLVGWQAVGSLVVG